MPEKDFTYRKRKRYDIVCETPLKQFSDSDFQFTFIANTEKVVTCNQDDNSVCIYDIVKNTVVTVKDKTILSPSCMAVGPLDSILVCSSVGNTIVHISPAGTIVGAYDLGLVSPLTCCISSDMKKIAVTSGKNGEQVLNVLDISYWRVTYRKQFQRILCLELALFLCWSVFMTMLFLVTTTCNISLSAVLYANTVIMWYFLFHTT